jgi:serine/threonine-protein kinase
MPPATPQARKLALKAAADASARAAPLTAVAAAAAPLPTGTVQIAISPWGRVEVDGATAGIAPPLTRLELPRGRHTISVHNEDFPAFSRSVQVDADRPVLLKHRFGP